MDTAPHIRMGPNLIRVRERTRTSRVDGISIRVFGLLNTK